MGHKVCTEDLLEAAHDPLLLVLGEDGKQTVDAARFLRDSLAYQGQKFDAVLAWDVPDYLPEAAGEAGGGAAVRADEARRNPAGVFPYPRCRPRRCRTTAITWSSNDTLQLQPTVRNSSSAFRLQRVFNNRHIENLFREFASLKFFLARDNVREVIVVR